MLPEPEAEVMQDVGGGDMRSGQGTTLVDREVNVPLIKKEDMWTPEDFLESTLHVHEDKSFLEDFNLPELCSQPAPVSTPVQKTAKPRTRRKNQWKLKFHHQALPPEYLDHYEASLNKPRPMAEKPTEKPQKNAKADVTPVQQLAFNNLPNESIQNWLQRITQIQNEINKNNAGYPNIAPAIPPQSRNVDFEKRKKPVHTNHPNKVVNYQDLPYMGEMTLNNSKPRRGRKPKKADICHLIYKNYGTIFPGTPTHLVDERMNQPCGSGLEKIKFEKPLSPTRSKTDLQNKIISSLLEKRLSQENKKTKEGKSKKWKHGGEAVSVNVEEPLNLCVRDLNNLKIKVHRKYGNVYEASTAVASSDFDTLSPCSPTPKMNIPDFNKALLEVSSEASDTPPLPGYVYWPNAGVFVHPMALQSQLMYYQKLAANNNYTLPVLEDGSESTMPSTPSSVDSDSTAFQKPTKRNIVPKQISELLDPSLLLKQTEETIEAPELQKIKRVAPTTNFNAGHPKRKRSAIFIPPLPTENNPNPTTEVSICKFKFTGGAKPSLQEKKMLSVDSGGNFRYYSGTGDKANRGYEFFPRETLQQPAGSEQASSSGVFLNTSGEKITSPSPQHTHSAPSTSVIKSTSPINDTDLNRRKRKSRKSIQREKLEQTFKEKGFLIQTQQLESAEGATYCKFRQLRKFTRYLFRSWKDYLPENLQNEENNSTSQEDPTQILGEGSSESQWS